MSVFKRFTDDDIVKANSAEVTTGLWSQDTGSLTAFYSHSAQASSSANRSGRYYWNVYNLPTSDANAEVQFAVAYGHRTGGGSPSLQTDDESLLETKAIYSQYKQLLLNPGDEQFTFIDYNSDHIYVINVARQLLRQTMDPGNWSLKLSGSNGIREFIDDSGLSLGNVTNVTGRVYNVVSGSLTGVSGSTVAQSTSSTAGGFGLFYPSLGVIVLNPQAIVDTVGFAAPGAWPVSSSVPFAPYTSSAVTAPQFNHAGLFNSIKLGGDFQARSAEIISSTNYFCNIGPKDFNYTNNPSYFDETTGNLINDDFINNPVTYITTVGLYNDQNELVAVGKLSRPTRNGPDRSLNVKVRLDF